MAHASPLMLSLREQIASCEGQLKHLRQQLAEAEKLATSDADDQNGTARQYFNEASASETRWTRSCTRPLELEEYRRYGRQLIMPEVGLSGIALDTFAFLVLHAH